MPVQQISYAAKRRGDLWTATDANEVKEVVNNNAQILNGHTSSLSTINNALDTMGQTVAQNSQTIRQIAADFTKSVWLTQEEYDELVENEEIEEDTEYNIYEEEA